jgi:hypothetical protein
MFLSVSQREQFFQTSNMVGNFCLHRWSTRERLLDPAKSTQPITLQSRRDNRRRHELP